MGQHIVVIVRAIYESIGRYTKAVGPRQTVCLLLPVQITAKMVTDKHDEYDELV